jgi:3-oxo-5-alpha-steroid 4-dehydrogenase 1
MAVFSLIVYVSLHYVNAGYGIFADKKWGFAISNRWGWFVMEFSIFALMLALWWFSDRRSNLVTLIFLLIFELHYFQRAFIFPFLIKGNSTMPIGIIAMGIFFNILNAFMQGGWLFYVSPQSRYSLSWLYSPQFIVGVVLFLTGFFVNMHSDAVIRHLRPKGDTRHYFPQKGLFKYVSSANYFGELVEWIGFAVLTWSVSGALFAVWTFANLAPRAAKINKKYAQTFPEEYQKIKPKRIIPFIY